MWDDLGPSLNQCPLGNARVSCVDSDFTCVERGFACLNFTLLLLSQAPFVVCAEYPDGGFVNSEL